MKTINRLEKYADVLIWALAKARTAKINPYDNVLVRYESPATALAEITHRKLIQKKLNPIMRLISGPTIEKDFLRHSDDKQLKFVPGGEKELYSSLNGLIVMYAPQSLTHLKSIDPQKIALPALAQKFIRDIRNGREAQGKFSWTLCVYPTQCLANQAGMSFSDYVKQVEKACFLNEANPVKKWEEVYKNAQEVKKWLFSLKIDSLRVESASIDLEVGLGEQRKFLGMSGHNIPSFETFTSPDWRKVRGTYYADQLSYRSGNLVQGVKLVFKNGEAVKVSAKQGEKFTIATTKTDEGAKRVGEFSLTDRRFSRIDKFMAHALYDENYGGKFGNCHIALGASYADTYAGNVNKLTTELKKSLGFNQSAVHWDLVNTENKRVTATLKNGKKMLIYEGGEFKR
ncbi:MAG: aminopeptidase [Elusimicrobia bacterium]|nr:aminopeptidase [Elusimicrobiota bacterium]